MLAATEGRSVRAITSIPRAFAVKATVVLITQKSINTNRAQLRPASTARPSQRSTVAATAKITARRIVAVRISFAGTSTPWEAITRLTIPGKSTKVSAIPR